MSPIFPIGLFIATQPQPSLVHECGRLKCLPRRLVRHFGGREFSEFTINQRQQLISRLDIASIDLLQNYGDVMHGRLLTEPNGE